MDIKTTADGTLATVAVAGTIDTRAAGDFEATLVKAVEGGAKRIVIDFARVDLITSAGIRVLVMFAKRLHGSGGGLALCALTPDVRRVFDIAGLASQFRIAATRDEAAGLLKPLAGAAPQARGSKVSRLVGALLGGGDEAAAGAKRTPPAGRSSLSKQVAQLLGEHQPRK